MAHPNREQFADTIRRTNYFYETYNRGQIDDPNFDKDAEEEYMHDPIPIRNGPWPGIRKGDFQRRPRGVRLLTGPLFVPAAGGVGAVREVQFERGSKQYDGMSKVREILNTPGSAFWRRRTYARPHTTFEVKFVKILGWGGMGVAALVRHFNPQSQNPGNIPKYYVLKTAFTNDGVDAVQAEGKKSLVSVSGYIPMAGLF